MTALHLEPMRIELLVYKEVGGYVVFRTGTKIWSNSIFLIKLFFTGIPLMNLRLPLKIAKIADYRRWHFGPSQLTTSFV